MSFKPPGFFKTSKYEKLRVQDAAKKRNAANSDEEEGESDDGEEEEEDSGTIQTKNAFALLAEDN